MPSTHSIERVLCGRLPYNQDLLKSLRELCQRERVLSGYVSIIGSLERAWLSYFDWAKKGYQTYSVEGPLELLSCQGNISLFEDAPFLHLHILVGGPDGRTWGGHLLEGSIVLSSEYTIFVYGGAPLRRVRDERTGMNVLERA